MALTKSKLTLWVRKETKIFGKRWVKKHHESLSQLFSDYLERLKLAEEKEENLTPIVKQLSGVIKSRKIERDDYKKHLEEKYLK